mmetsp:Transcript_11853/g.19541  ORF Transcript_11853/g.19541 Transcript_11853/m.19541 type:complete len:413 (+) Transcript_11853:39-1277(+)
MKAFVYGNRKGVIAANLRVPKLRRNVIDSILSIRLDSIFRSIILWWVGFYFYAISVKLYLLRRFVWSWIPPPHGYNPNRYYVLCRVHAVGVNPVDAKFLYGDKVPEWMLPLVQWFVSRRVAGIDFSGEVVDTPSSYSFRVGEQVFGTMPPFVGALSEYVLAPSDSIARKPANLTHVQAAVVPLVGLTALQILDDFHVDRLGHRLLIIGASGGTGHYLVQLAKCRGVHVTAICSAKNARYVSSLGADVVVPYDTGTLLPALGQTVDDLGMFDTVIDTVSSNEKKDLVKHCYNLSYYRIVCQSGMMALLHPPPRGKYIQTGGFPIDWLGAHMERFLGIKAFRGNRHLFWVRFPNSAHYLETLREYCEQGRLKVFVSEIMPFTLQGVQSSFQKVLTRRVVGKLAIDVMGETPSLQ